MTVDDILSQIEALEPGLERAYLDTIRRTVDAVTLAEVERRLAEEDEQGLAALLALGSLATLAELVRSAYIAGARYEMAIITIPRSLRPQVGRLEFDQTRPPVEAWVASQVADLRRQAADNVRDAIRAVVASRRTVGGTLQARQAALDLLGRASPQTGQRVGGVLGMPGTVARHVANARDQLQSADPAKLGAFLRRARRDRRQDGIVRRAIEAGRAVKDKDVERIVGRYSERLMRTHVDLLAKNLAHESFNAGRQRAWEQLAEQGLPIEQIDKEWSDRADEKVRTSHRAMRGQRVGLREAFRAPSGVLLRFPGDSSLGAGYDETAGCRCICIYHLKV